jgi:hypothetical protein
MTGINIIRFAMPAYFLGINFSHCAKPLLLRGWGCLCTGFHSQSNFNLFLTSWFKYGIRTSPGPSKGGVIYPVDRFQESELSQEYDWH